MEGPKNHADNWAVGVFFNKPQESQPPMRSVLWTSLFFLFMGLGSSEKDSTPMVVSGILGGSVTLPVNISVDTEIENVAWTGLNEALVLARPKGDLTFLVKSYESRINISGSYSLYIRNLTQKDAGFYKAQINQKNSEVTAKKEFILHVYEHVQEPQVTMKSIIVSENASCNITLMCSVKGSENDVLYSWTQRDTNTSESYRGSILTISPKLCDPDLSYTCTARNPVSQSSSRPVQAWHFCTGTSSINTMGETVVGTLGEPFTLPLALPVSQDTENIVWKFNTSLISKEWKGAAMADPLIKPNGSDESRVWVSSQDYSLKISQLKMEDAGPYHAYVCSEASRVTSMKHVILLVYRPKENKLLWIWLSPVFILPLLGIFSWYMWKKRRGVLAAREHWGLVYLCVPEPTASHTIYTMVSQGHEKLDILPKTTNHWSRPSSDTSSSSNITTEEEDEERTPMHSSVNGKDEVYDWITQDVRQDSAAEGQTEYVILDDTAVRSVVEGDLEYTQVVLNLQEKNLAPEKKESSVTIYCSIQKPQKVRTIFCLPKSIKPGVVSHAYNTSISGG
uniref:Lymphocyte antigen 9 n=1 Tax=Sciurus vulgaris TaxID=55149 RepID=A0A8D2B6W6_SCIVU